MAFGEGYGYIACQIRFSLSTKNYLNDLVFRFLLFVFFIPYWQFKFALLHNGAFILALGIFCNSYLRKQRFRIFARNIL